MALVFQRGFAIPLWVIALCAVVVASPSPLPSSFTTLLVIAVTGFLTIGLVRWLDTFRRAVAVIVATHPECEKEFSPTSAMKLDVVKTGRRSAEPRHRAQ
jgi:hypothetical protein